MKISRSTSFRQKTNNILLRIVKFKYCWYYLILVLYILSLSFTFFTSPPTNGRYTTIITQNNNEDSTFLQLMEQTSKAQSPDYSLPKIRKQKKITIFYHTYSHPNDGETMHTQRAQKIVKKQLDNINSQPLLEESTIYYSRFGNYEDWEWPMDLCRRTHRECIEVMTKNKGGGGGGDSGGGGNENEKNGNGNDMNMLQPLYEYCQSNQKDRVLYLHNIGSNRESSSQSQFLLRSILMPAITSLECLNFRSDSRCDACSSQLATNPVPHYIGNMWVAECQYIVKLIQPQYFESIKRNMLQNMTSNTHKIQDTEYSNAMMSDGKVIPFPNDKLVQLEDPSLFGIDKFASEHWLGSHPDFIPCEVFSPKNETDVIIHEMTNNIDPDNMIPKLKKAPGGVRSVYPLDDHLIPWVRAKGILEQYRELYKKVPGDKSWFYKFFHQSLEEINY